MEIVPPGSEYDDIVPGLPVYRHIAGKRRAGDFRFDTRVFPEGAGDRSNVFPARVRFPGLYIMKGRQDRDFEPLRTSSSAKCLSQKRLKNFVKPYFRETRVSPYYP
jgi:hypothetical protein